VGWASSPSLLDSQIILPTTSGQSPSDGPRYHTKHITPTPPPGFRGRWRRSRRRGSSTMCYCVKQRRIQRKTPSVHEARTPPPEARGRSKESLFIKKMNPQIRPTINHEQRNRPLRHRQPCSSHPDPPHRPRRRPTRQRVHPPGKASGNHHHQGHQRAPISHRSRLNQRTTRRHRHTTPLQSSR